MCSASDKAVESSQKWTHCIDCRLIVFLTSGLSVGESPPPPPPHPQLPCSCNCLNHVMYQLGLWTLLVSNQVRTVLAWCGFCEVGSKPRLKCNVARTAVKGLVIAWHLYPCERAAAGTSREGLHSDKIPRTKQLLFMGSPAPVLYSRESRKKVLPESW